MPRCAWILVGAIVAILNHTIGLPATINFAFAVIAWTLTTPAALVAIAALAAWHLTAFHAPRLRRRTTRTH